jgi:hypothetical protein
VILIKMINFSIKQKSGTGSAWGSGIGEVEVKVGRRRE